MLAELALRLLTPAAPMVRRLGLSAEAVSLWSRGRRQGRAWAAHHERCRSEIAAIVEALPRRRKALILGSGPMRDMPLALLSQRFDQVILADCIHLPMLRRQARRLGNVTLATRDLSGVMDWLDDRRDGRDDPVANWIADPAIDLVVSANLASQLAWPVEDWLAADAVRATRFPPDLPARCIGWHLDDLRRFAGRVCLIGDVEMIERDRAGRVTDRLDLMRGNALPPADAGWPWPVAPFGEAARDRETVHEVRIWRDFAKGA